MAGLGEDETSLLFCVYEMCGQLANAGVFVERCLS